jgi:hypothetical protein
MSGLRKTLAAPALGSVASILAQIVACIPVDFCDAQMLEQMYTEAAAIQSAAGSNASSSSSSSSDTSRSSQGRQDGAQVTQQPTIAQPPQQLGADGLQQMAIDHRGLACRLFTASYRAIHLCNLYNGDLADLGKPQFDIEVWHGPDQQQCLGHALQSLHLCCCSVVLKCAAYATASAHHRLGQDHDDQVCRLAIDSCQAAPACYRPLRSTA